MQINSALILCAGLGKRLNPLTLKTPKPLLLLKDKTILEKCVSVIIKLGIKKIYLNTFYLSEQILNFIKNKNFPINIQIIDDGKDILDTGGGILNMINNSSDSDYLIFNPDTLWNENYINEIKDMCNFYFLNKLSNILLTVEKKLSFDKSLKGDFQLRNNLLKRENENNFIYIGCQILNRNLFKEYRVENFSISEIWDDLLQKNELNGFESFNKFYHLTNLETFKKLKDL
ncbi:sugar phosphate nucleotidyltransferase [Candidatus Pelagibacter sp.]|nr:sugar phosphate nucleotidyltransferase [Candidatus Pelagibacter sp.]